MNPLAIDASAAGAAFALSNGAFEALAVLLQRELILLGRISDSGAASLAQLTSLGAGLFALSPEVAPIGMMAGALHPSAGTVAQSEMDRLPQHRSASVDRIRMREPTRSPAGPGPAMAASTPRRDKPDQTIAPAGFAALPDMPNAEPGGLSEPLPPAPDLSAALVPVPAIPPAVVSIFQLPSQGDVSSAPQTSLSTPAPSDTLARWPEADVPIAGAGPTTPFTVGRQSDDGRPPASAPVVLGSAAPWVFNGLPPSSASAPATGRPAAPIDDLPPTADLGGRSANNATRSTVAPPAGPAPGAPEATTAGPRQGTIILDGARLGRWMFDRMARDASRPIAGVTGVDPRISATYPGASAGT